MKVHGRRVLAGAALAGVLLLSGCGAAGSERSSAAGGADAAAPAQPARPAPPRTAAGAGGAADGKAGAAGTAAPTADATAGRAIAYTGGLVLESSDPERAVAGARQLVTAGGGFVGGESQSGTGASFASKLVLRVPSAGYQRAMDSLAGLGTVVSRTSQADDLTQQVVDVDSRVKTQQASVDRVRALLADAKSLSDVVSLEGELTRREADLESLKRQQQELSAQTSLSTITLDVHRPPHVDRAPQAGPRGFWSSVGHAFAGGWQVFVAVLRALAVALAATAPFLAVGALVAWPVRRWLKRRPARPRPVPTVGWADPAPHWGVPAQRPAPVPGEGPTAAEGPMTSEGPAVSGE